MLLLGSILNQEEGLLSHCPFIVEYLALGGDESPQSFGLPQRGQNMTV